MSPIPTSTLRVHYDKTALARMGIPFEQGIRITGVRIALEGAARAAVRREMTTKRAAA